MITSLALLCILPFCELLPAAAIFACFALSRTIAGRSILRRHDRRSGRIQQRILHIVWVLRGVARCQEKDGEHEENEYEV